MISRAWALLLSDVLGLVGVGRDGRLPNGRTSPETQPHSPSKRSVRASRSQYLWMGPDWEELVADCPCDDCRVQWAARTN